MRTLITIFTILFLLAGGSFLTHEYIQTSTHSLLIRLENVQQAISDQNWPNAHKELATTHESWEKNKTWWSILLDHKEIDDIDLSIKRLEKYMVTENKPLSLGETATLLLLFDDIVDSEQLTLRNIL